MAATSLLSFYDRINHVNSKEVLPYDLLLHGIKDGKWQDLVLRIRTTKDKKMRDQLKQELLPSVTISGKFEKRYDANIEKHSGKIGIDIDEEDFPDGMTAQEFKELIIQDPYVQSAFISASGRGLCIIFNINSSKHREAFQGLCEYIFKNYRAICDPTSINESRARFVSFDPDLYDSSSEAPKFLIYPTEKPPKKIDKVVYAKNDFEELLMQITSRHLDITGGYDRWLRVGFALAHKFNETGRHYYHQISQFNSTYNSQDCDRQYTNCIRHKGTRVSTISTIYYYCKQAGLSLYSERTRKIAITANSNKQAGLNKVQIKEILAKHENITGPDVEDIIDQVLENGIEINEDSLIDQLEMFLRQNYSMRRNVITRYIDDNGKRLGQEDMNSIFLRAKKIYDKLTYELMDRLIHSNFIENYNPFEEFFEANIERGQDPTIIDKFFSSIKNRDPNYCQYFGKKWLVGLISAMHGNHSPLVLVLCGEEQGTGKTEFFRRLLPKELYDEKIPEKGYYAESKLDAGKDDYIVMTQKIIVMDDEMGGKSKKEAKVLKELTSKQVFTLRAPYGKFNEDLRRLAVLCGTTNEKEILSDPTGNRRIIPVLVEYIDHSIYNSIDKTELIMAAYHLYKSGFEWQVIKKPDIAYLRQDESLFEVKSIEGELISKFYVPAKIEALATKLTASEIKVNIDKLTQQKLSLTTIGRELQRMKFVQKHVATETGTKRVYLVDIVGEDNAAPPF